MESTFHLLNNVMQKFNGDEDEGMSQDELKLTLLMDEMKIKQGLVLSKCTGEMVGFTDLGTVNEALASLQKLQTVSIALKWAITC